MRSTRPIVSDPAKFDGALHVEGTDITIDQVKEFWALPGVGAVEMRRRFPSLSETELGAAVTYVEPHSPAFHFIAESAGPPRRRLHIWSDLVGWCFAVDEISHDGAERLGFGTWEETWDQILLYPKEYAPIDVEWRKQGSDEVVDPYALEGMQ